ncbi:hypothetical protein DFH07DRAFT_1025080 [Mycena maculata]|uniref:Uncharacterized protein n=1 Tax=Mycena maculata TaxID=230809 RepID=A0AAD7J6K8_9AGAR|nr:hypothetical protein DFH07DRAFT_1025080 [Mycena maculata]
MAPASLPTFHARGPDSSLSGQHAISKSLKDKSPGILTRMVDSKGSVPQMVKYGYTDGDDNNVVGWLADPKRLYEDYTSAALYKPLGPQGKVLWSHTHDCKGWHRRAMTIPDLQARVLAAVETKLEITRQKNNVKPGSKAQSKHSKPGSDDETPAPVKRKVTFKEAEGHKAISADIARISKETQIPRGTVNKLFNLTRSIIETDELLREIIDAIDGRGNEDADEFERVSEEDEEYEDSESEDESLPPKPKSRAQVKSAPKNSASAKPVSSKKRKGDGLHEKTAKKVKINLRRAYQTSVPPKPGPDAAPTQTRSRAETIGAEEDVAVPATLFYARLRQRHSAVPVRALHYEILVRGLVSKDK